MARCISIWNPFALLLVKGFKTFETRTWPAPKSLIGQRIGIASTRVLQPAQKAHFEDPEFRRFYWKLGLPEMLIDLPNGYMLGTAVIDSCELMTSEFMEEVSEEEHIYGHWEEGNYAWRMTDPVEFEHPFPVRGKQGLWEWKIPDDVEEKRRETIDPKRQADLWRNIRPA